MTSLIILLDMSRINFNNNPAKALEELEDAVSFAREGQKDLRNSIYCLTYTGFDGIRGLKLLESMLSNFRRLGVNVDFSVEGNRDIENCKLWETIYRICQEALTNAVRHGKAQNVTIILKFAANSVKLYIFDDGRGCGEIKKGIGLSGMEQRVAALCGVIVYGSGEDGGGFNINVQIPV
jgi:signal transduction histidine kinase